MYTVAWFALEAVVVPSTYAFAVDADEYILVAFVAVVAEFAELAIPASEPDTILLYVLYEAID